MAAHARAWSELAETRLAQAGFRRGGARAAVIELLDDQSCALSAYEIEAKLRESGRGAARADHVVVMAGAELEATIDRVAERVTFDVAEHEIVLHGACADCQR